MALAMASTGSRERKGRGFFDSLREREEDSVICRRGRVGFESLSMLLYFGSDGLVWRRGTSAAWTKVVRPGQRAYTICRRIIHLED